MKIGLLSAILPDSSFEEVIDTVSEIGYQSVELACWPLGKAERRYAGVTHIDIASMDEQRAAYIQKYCRDHNISISALGYYPNPLDPSTPIRLAAIEHIKSLIIGAKKLGVDKISTFIGRDKNKSIEENIELFKEIWPPIIELAEKEKVWIGIENCPMYFTKDEWPGGVNLASSPHIWREMFSIIDSSYFGLAYDPSHLHLQRIDYIQPLYTFKDKIKHVHLKDIRVYPEKLNEFGIFSYPLNYMSPKIPGHGGIDWGLFMSSLSDIDYQGTACVEIEDKTFEKSQEDILKALKLSYNHLSQFI